MKEKILIVDDEESIRFTFQSFLEEAGYAAVAVRGYGEAMQSMEETSFDLVFIDIILEDRSGIDLLRSIKDRNPECQVIIVTGAPTVETAAESLKMGALDYIVKPVRQDTLLRAAGMALRHKALADAKERYRMNLEAILRSVIDGIISVNHRMEVVEINDAAVQLCRIDPARARGRTLAELDLPCGGTCRQAMAETLKQKQTVRVDYVECRLHDRPDQVVSVVASPLIDSKKDFSGGVMVVRDLTRLLRLERRLEYHQGFDRIVGNSEAIQKVLLLAGNLANVQTSVLITGESGTGKELVADAIHAMGDRSQKSMVKVNCSALTESLLESELFGHVRGAFTGAVEDKLGRFQKADGGTIFLDEIGEISAAMQLRFLRVLEQMEIERVGDSTPVRIDVRVIAATNRDLRQKMLRGEFREDLFYRLNVVEIRMPPLRERRGDIQLLIKHFLDLFNKKFEKNIAAVSPDVREIFMHHPWPGNVRELKNTLEHAFILCDRNVITAADLPPDFAGGSIAVSAPEGDPAGIDERRILQALSLSSGNKSRAAKFLGISRRTLYRKIEQFKMPPD